MTGRPPLKAGDRIWVENVNVSLTDTPELVDGPVTVHRVTDMNCGCWRVTCHRFDVPGSYIALYGADCSWPHEDRIDYAAALAAAEGALFPVPSRPQRRVLVPVPAQDAARRVEELEVSEALL